MLTVTPLACTACLFSFYGFMLINMFLTAPDMSNVRNSYCQVEFLFILWLPLTIIVVLGVMLLVFASTLLVDESLRQRCACFDPSRLLLMAIWASAPLASFSLALFIFERRSARCRPLLHSIYPVIDEHRPYGLVLMFTLLVMRAGGARALWNIVGKHIDTKQQKTVGAPSFSAHGREECTPPMRPSLLPFAEQKSPHLDWRLLHERPCASPSDRETKDQAAQTEGGDPDELLLITPPQRLRRARSADFLQRVRMIHQSDHGYTWTPPARSRRV